MAFEVSQMLNSGPYNHPVTKIELIETHISWVILTGEFAYKIKKPVDFGFLDFSTLNKRKQYCEQELQLNRRLAPSIYLEVVSISGSSDEPIVTTSSSKQEPLEYAVKMRQFPQSSQLDNMLVEGHLGVDHIDALAQMVATFHQAKAVADDSLKHGNKNIIFGHIIENFELINKSLATNTYNNKLDHLKNWTATEFSNIESVLEQRQRDGFIRECHGDMHLRNLVWLDRKPVAFDCIEFNADLRWIDVISEIAFLIMDLQHRKQEKLANRFLNAYLQITGDYSGLRVLPFYLSYRAVVRAKVDALRIAQLKEAQIAQEFLEFDSYLDLAVRYTVDNIPALIITRGLSASGKSTVSQQLLENTGTIRIRSDVERKRLFDISLNSTDSDSTKTNVIDKGIYTQQASQQTYTKLLELAQKVISAGYNVIIDAAFLEHKQRIPFKELASNLAVPYIILEITAPHDVLRKRIKARENDISDANLDVLEHQISTWKPLYDEELKYLVSVDTEKSLDVKKLLSDFNDKLAN